MGFRVQVLVLRALGFRGSGVGVGELDLRSMFRLYPVIMGFRDIGFKV